MSIPHVILTACHPLTKARGHTDPGSQTKQSGLNLSTGEKRK